MSTATLHSHTPSSPDSDQETITVNRAVMMTALASPIAYYAAFAKAVGDVCAGVFVSQLFYWHDKGADPDGWIYKTRDEIHAETGLSRRNQQTARKRLVGLGVLEEQRRGMPARMHFRLNLERLFALVEAIDTPPPPDDGPAKAQSEESTNGQIEGNSPVGTVRTNKKARTVPTRRYEPYQLVGANRTNNPYIQRLQQKIHQRLTTTTTRRPMLTAPNSQPHHCCRRRLILFYLLYLKRRKRNRVRQNRLRRS